MHPDPHPPNTAPMGLDLPARRSAHQPANAVRPRRALLGWAALGMACAALLLGCAWVALTAGGAAGFLIGVLLGLAGIAAGALACATLAEWRERRA